MAKKQPDQKAGERRRLKDAAFSKGLLSRGPSKPPLDAPLLPSKTVIRHQGRDIVKKGQRKNRFLFSFPGFLAPASAGGKIGELSNLASGNPILYLDFPQGRMKLFGTIVYPKNRYLTLQFARKNVLCEDSFDSMVIFSDAWWIGRKEDNPEENQLKFPDELNKAIQEFDFKGGVGDVIGEKSTNDKSPVKQQTKMAFPDVELTDDTSEDSDHAIKDVMQARPVRQSTRTMGKSLNYAEDSSEEEPIIGESSEADDMDDQTINKVFCPSEDQCGSPHHTWSSGVQLNDTKEQEEEVSKTSPLKNSKDKSSNKQGTLVQATLSTLFTKATKKVNSDKLEDKSRSDGNKRRK